MLLVDGANTHGGISGNNGGWCGCGGDGSAGGGFVMDGGGTGGKSFINDQGGDAGGPGRRASCPTATAANR